MLFDKLRQIEERSHDIARRLADPAIFSQQAEYARLRKEHADTQEIVERFTEYRDVLKKITEAQHILAEGGDRELQEMAQAEIEELSGRQTELEAEIKRLLLPRDPNDAKNAFVEIRAGAGGDEAALFAADLARMYTKYAERQRWKIEIMDSSATGVGGLKEVILFDAGQGRVEPAQVRARRPSRAARAGHRVGRAHPHLDGDGGGAAGGRGRRDQGRREGHPRGRLSLVGARAARASTRRTPRCASRTFPPAWS